MIYNGFCCRNRVHTSVHIHPAPKPAQKFATSSSATSPVLSFCHVVIPASAFVEKSVHPIACSVLMVMVLGWF